MKRENRNRNKESAAIYTRFMQEKVITKLDSANMPENQEVSSTAEAMCYKAKNRNIGRMFDYNELAEPAD